MTIMDIFKIPLQSIRTTFFVGLLHVFVLVHGHNKTIIGYVRDAETGENLIGATIYDMVSKKGAVTNVYGFYSLTLNTDSVRLNISFVGYETQEFNKPIKANIEADFDLQYSEVLDAVTVVGEESVEDILDANWAAYVGWPRFSSVQV